MKNYLSICVLSDHRSDRNTHHSPILCAVRNYSNVYITQQNEVVELDNVLTAHAWKAIWN